jgi:hypothetical protein
MCLLADTLSLSVSAIERPAAPNIFHKGETHHES